MKKALSTLLRKMLPGWLYPVDRLPAEDSGQLFLPDALDLAIKGSALGFYDWHVASGEFRIDRHWMALLGYQPGELQPNAESVRNLVSVEDRLRMEQRLFEAIKSDEQYAIDFRALHKDGHTRWARVTGAVAKRDPITGAPLRVCGTMQDIAAERHREIEREQFRRFFQLSTDPMIIGQLGGNAIRVNQATIDVFGYTEAEYCAMNLMDTVHPDDVAATLAEMASQAKTGNSLNFENRVVSKDGTVRWFSWRARYDDVEKLSYATGRDISESKRLHEQLRQQQELYTALVNNTEDVTTQFDRQHRHTYANRAVIKALNRQPEEFLGKTRREMGFAPELCQLWEDAVERVFVTGQPYSTFFDTVNASGTYRLLWNVFPGLVENGVIKTVFSVSRDISQYMKVEEEIRRMQRLNSLGVLAGGIAHDFNNILTILFGNIALAKSLLPADAAARNTLEQAELAYRRATSLTGQLLTFAKGGEPLRQDVSISALVMDVVQFDLSGSNVRLVFNASEALWHAMVDPGQISQVFSNLALNARDAMPDGGRLHISAENCLLAKNAVPGLDAGHYLKFSVRDEGVGMDRATLEKIFDPYFTTKEKGTGLGLATVYSIVKRHGGLISVESGIGVGTVFTLYLPASLLEKAATNHPASAKLPAANQTRARVLIMDDEDMICDVCSTYLSARGYSVDCVADGNEAIVQVRNAMRAGTPYDCLIMDLTIPGGMGGKQAIGEILNVQPSARVIVSSGYAADPVMAHYEDHGFRGCLAKPFPLAALLQEVQRVLA